MHLIDFVETRINLLNGDVALIFHVNDAKDRLVLLLVNSELLLHFEGRLG